MQKILQIFPEKLKSFTLVSMLGVSDILILTTLNVMDANGWMGKYLWHQESKLEILFFKS